MSFAEIKMEKYQADKEVIAIIPARGGSKGVPCKNIKPLCGKPLIAYTIEVALRARNISRIVVSTDDDDIAAVAESYGAEVPFLRPREIAGDTAVVTDAIMHTLAELKKEGYYPDARVIMYPTHPFRKVESVEHMVGKLAEGARHVYSVTKVDQNEFSYLHRDDQDNMIKLLDSGICPSDNKYYRKSGYLYGMHHAQGECYNEEYIYCLKDEIETVDIDYPSDFKVAEEVVRRGLYRI